MSRWARAFRRIAVLFKLSYLHDLFASEHKKHKIQLKGEVRNAQADVHYA